MREKRLILEFPAHGRVDEINGLLLCSHCADDRWCAHIEGVIRDGTDGKRPANEMFKMVTVPIVPTHDFWVMVELSDDKDFRKVTLISGCAWFTDSRLDPATDRCEPAVLGYLGSGEGRMVIRRMVIEWLRPQYRTVSACTSRLHRHIRWSRADDRTLPLKGDDWGALWSLITTGICKVCATSVTDLTQDAPVLSTLHHRAPNWFIREYSYTKDFNA